MSQQDPLHRVLYIDLSRRDFHVEDRPDLFEAGLGGTGVGIRLLEKHCPEGADALGKENPIIFTVGPLTGLFPLASKTVAMFKSPLTQELGESHCGGRSAVSIRMAGYGAVVIQGQSRRPIYLVIKDDKVHFRDASALWGTQSSYTTGSVLRKRERGSGYRTIMRIGRAGEEQVRYACVITETYRHFGRLGLGAVFGSKRLKAVVVQGKRNLPVTDRAAYRKVYDRIYTSATESPLMQKYHELGTPMNVIPLDALGGLPTRNLQSGSFEGAKAISGERLAADFLGRRVACAHCPVACIHLAALRIPYPNDPYFYKTLMLGYDHEPIYATGSMLGIDDVPGMLRLMDEIEVQGLDVMSAGVALAWTTEMFERGLISESETDNIQLRFGNADTYIKTLQKIVSQPTDFYAALARGTDYASSIYGGEDFALAFGKNEMPGYHTGPACHVGYLTGARHSHLDSAGYSLDQQAAQAGYPLTPESIAESLIAEERWRQVLTSLVICLFARKVYDRETILETLATTGFEWDGEDLDRLGTETLRLKYDFKSREGFDLRELRIPKRIMETPAPAGAFDEPFLRDAIEHYAKALAT